MTGPVSNTISIQVGPFNNPAQKVNAVDFVLHYNNNTWNNNNGQDFHIPINNNPVSLPEPSQRQLISAWPVPAETQIFVGVPVQFSSGYLITLRNLTGSALITEPVAAENFSLNISGLSAGFYLLCLENPEGMVMASRKIVKK
jgi:hypothetical protein